jgi:hypothetical protein
VDANQIRLWSENHKKLTGIILKPHEHNAAVELFLSQHSLLHASEMSHSAVATLEDDLFSDLREETIRKYPVKVPGTKNSIAWHIWHITRIEDMTMNVLVHNQQQVFHAGEWPERLKVEVAHSGNEMPEDEIASLSAHIDIAELLAYRMEVGRKTREVVSSLRQGDFKMKVAAERIQALREQGAVKEEASWLLDYWGGKTIAGLILMPATRHLFMHLNKSIRIKEKLQKIR